MVHASNLAEYVREATVTAVVDTDLDSARRAAQALPRVSLFASLEDALEAGIADAFVITTPTPTHKDLTVLAARSGKHVFCEKPMALSPGDCRAMMSACQTAGIVLQIGFMRHFQPEFVEAKKRIVNGDIGRPMIVKSLTRGPGLPPEWAWDLRSSNGMLAEVNSHDFDCVRWLAGADIIRVYAETANFKGPSRGVTVENFYDNAVVALRFAGDTIGTIDGTCPADYGYDARFEVVGSEGLLTVGDVRGQPLLEVRNRDIGAVTPVHRTWPERFAEGYRQEMRAFVTTVLDRSSPQVNGIDGHKALCAVIAANRSWQEGRPVSLEEVEGA